MIKRDKEILDTVELFRCLSRDQVATLFFNHCKKPTTNANNALKRLRDRGYLDIARDIQPYVYMVKPAPIKSNSNKIEHFKAIGDVYIALKQRYNVKTFDVEPRYDNARVRPDIFTIAKGTPFFIEVQNSVYTNRTMQQKINLYREYYDSGEYTSLSWQPKGKRPIFPYIILISKTKYDIESGDLQVLQFKTVDEFITVLG